MAIKVFRNGTAVPVTEVKIRNGAAFSLLKAVRVKISGAWQTVWQAVTQKQYTKDYAVSASQIYWGTGGKETDYASQLIQGSYASSLSTARRTLMLFPSAIAADLEGAQINSVQLYIKRLSSSHGTEKCALSVKKHAFSSLPSRWEGNDGGSAMSAPVTLTRGQAKWITLLPSVGEGLKNGTVKGLCLDADDSCSLGSYGRFEKSSVRLRITYTKEE